MTLEHILVPIVDDSCERAKEKKGDWVNSPWETIWQLSPDEKGHVGELFCAEVLRKAGHHVEFDPNITDPEKDYDMLVDKVRVEVKLACRGKIGKHGRANNTFQHENLDYTRHWDVLVIIDLAPTEIYVQITAKKNLPRTTGIHVRPDGRRKYDLSVAKHKKEGNEVKTAEDFSQKFKNALIQ